VELWELVVRECIRDSLARYNWAGDSLRLAELAESFCEDGELEVRGSEPVRGRAAIVEFLGGVAAAPASSSVKRIVRHNLTNIRFTEMTPENARVASYFTVFTEIGLDHYGRYRDTFVPVGGEWLIKHRFVSTDWRSPASTIAAAPRKLSRYEVGTTSHPRNPPAEHQE
jgi:SnoaL-like domain